MLSGPAMRTAHRAQARQALGTVQVKFSGCCVLLVLMCIQFQPCADVVSMRQPMHMEEHVASTELSSCEGLSSCVDMIAFIRLKW
mmetsp:Transcript_16603/g.49678  ORF Transcript_16603/g.49678 Transcript_16603/m.49678 type:complete len:85 (-) Transcript_16603:206-460(-)